jgi:methyltransferase family protein
VLDVGAGDATLLCALHARGREAKGLERVASGPHVMAGDIEDVNERWAAIVFWHSLEHLRTPRRALIKAAQLLLPGGVVIVAIPNIESLQAAAFGDRWFGWDLPRHLVHVSTAALLSELGDAGLTPTRISHVRGGQVTFGWAHGLVGLLPGRPDLYRAIRTSAAQDERVSGGRRVGAIAAGAIATPLALAAAAIEVASRRGGSVYVEATRFQP